MFILQRGGYEMKYSYEIISEDYSLQTGKTDMSYEMFKESVLDDCKIIKFEDLKWKTN